MTKFPQIFLARHGETAWTISGQHTGRSDIPLTAEGEREAKKLGDRLAGKSFVQVWTSPLIRAVTTCELAGFGDTMVRDPDLLEWDYGTYDGKTSPEIRRENPHWDLFRDGCPGGETPRQVSDRADRVVQRIRAVDGDVLLFGHSHFTRVLGARWLGLSIDAARYLVLSTASLSVVGYEHTLDEPVIRLWNDDRHIQA